MKRTYHIAVGLVLVSSSIQAHPGCAVETRRVTTQVVTETAPAMPVAPVAPAQPVAPAASNKIELTQSADFDKHLQNNKNVIVALTATWCGPCQTLKPVLDEISNENKDVTLVIVDGDKFPAIRQKHAPQGFPTLKFFKDGKEVSKIEGGSSRAEMKEDLQSGINRYFKGGIPVFETVTAPEPAAAQAPAPAPAPAKPAPAPSVASGNRIELGSSADFDSYLKKDKVLAVFSTTWCGPCKALKPVLEELVTANRHVTFVFVDGDKFPSLVQRYSSTGFPTLKFFKNGKDVGQSIGGDSKSGLQNMINSKLGGSQTAMSS